MVQLGAFVKHVSVQMCLVLEESKTRDFSFNHRIPAQHSRSRERRMELLHKQRGSPADTPAEQCSCLYVCSSRDSDSGKKMLSSRSILRTSVVGIFRC